MKRDDAREIRSDQVAEHIDLTLYDWLVRTAETATSNEDVQNVFVGALAALSRFAWDNRQPDASIETIATGVAEGVRTCLMQLAKPAGRA